MYTFVKIPISLNHVTVVFPNKCVYCGLPAETKIVEEVKGSSHYEAGNKFVSKLYSTKITIPFCYTHKEDSKRNNTILTRTLLTLSLIGGGLFLAEFFGGLKILAYPLGLVNMDFFWAVVIHLLILAGGVYVVFGLTKYVLSLFVKTLRYQTISSGEFLNALGALGIRCTYTRKKDALRFRFVNAEIAREFSKLNGQGT